MYLVDSNVFIDAKNKHYAFDIVPGFWDWLDRAHHGGKVFTVQAVADEVIAGGDDLSAWMKSRPVSFRLPPDQHDQDSLARLSQLMVGDTRYEPAAVSTFLGLADYFLVGQGHARGWKVVTHETPGLPSRKRVKIPDACRAMGVACMSPFAMLRAESARFHLST